MTDQKSERVNSAPAGTSQHSFRTGIQRRARSFVTATMLLVAVGIGIGIDRLALDFVPASAQNGTALYDAENIDILEQTYNVIRDSYVLSDEVSDEELVYGASRGMVDALGDEGHSRFLTPEEAQRFVESSEGELVGIGVQVDTTELPVRVIMPIQDSPAFEAGIRAGDLILAIDGADTTTFSNASEAADQIRGDEGTDVTLEIQREGEPESFEVTITRERIQIDPVSWAMMPNDVLWVHISQFSRGATANLEAALVAGKDQGATSVILDLRSNPGGLVEEARGVGSQFLPAESVLYQEQDADGNLTEVSLSEDDGQWLDGPLVVLVDRYSASASEITSSAISENGRGLLVGETTYGTGTVLLPMELRDESMVLIGTELWLTANGADIWHQGVDPEIEVSNDTGVQISLPYLFEGNALTDDQVAGLEDRQLLTAYDQALAAASGG